MSVAKVTEITSQSPEGFEDAIRKGIQRAAKTVEHIQEAWVQNQKVVVENGQVTMFRVDMKVTFVLKE